jgi:hypothetical protein
MNRQEWLLATTLDISVPLDLAILYAMGEADREEAITRWAMNAADLITQSDASLLYPIPASPRTERHAAEPGTAATFAALSKGLAAGAHSPGGITFLGRHWCVDHTRCEAAEIEAAEKRRGESRDK